MAWEIDLTGKTAVVAGGSRGIGAEICRQFAIAGADVVFSYNSAEQKAAELTNELKGLGVKAFTAKCDVADEQQVKDLMALALRELGKIDILVVNAAMLLSAKFEEMTTDQWRQMMSVLLDGAYFCARHAVPSMLENGYGKILFISSNASINGGGGSAAYPAAKAGMEGLAKQLVKEYAAKGIITNIISPCVIDTDLFRQRYPTDEIVAEYGKTLPVGHVGKPKDIADACVFFASDKANYIVGHNLLVDGGRTYYK